MSFWPLLKWFLFQWDAEKVHHWALRFIRLGMCFRCTPIYWITGAVREKEVPAVANVFGLDFISRVGLAAGFDKNAEIVQACSALGFGFVEVGTVTLLPQKGHPRPRLFRYVKNKTLFNRMGFNNEGASVISQRLRETRAQWPSSLRVGVNLGKNQITCLEDAPREYAQLASFFNGLADYLVVNVSSPNTSGLRLLQSTDALKQIISSILAVISPWAKAPPLLIKLAPELQGDSLTHLIQSLDPIGVGGWVLTNTMAGILRLSGSKKLADAKELVGGWSGSVLTQVSLKSLIEARQVTQKPIISVGGILSVEDAQARLSLGADLIQVYTGWVYGGPRFPVALHHGTKNEASFDHHSE